MTLAVREGRAAAGRAAHRSASATSSATPNRPPCPRASRTQGILPDIVAPVSAFLVTGASTGIGRATAMRLDGAGHRVFATVRKPEDAASLSEAASDRLVPVELDVTDAKAIDAASEQVDSALGAAGLDGLVN